MFKAESKRALGLLLLVAAASYWLLQINGVSYLLSDVENDPFMIFEFSTSMGFAAPLLPLVAALPFAASFCADHQSGYSGMIVLRGGKRRYLITKSLCNMMAGALAVGLGMLAFLVLIYVKFPKNLFESPAVVQASGLFAWTSGGVLPYYAARLGILMFAGAFWAMTALCFSAFYPNTPLTLCMPLVLGQLFEALSGRGALPAWLDVTRLVNAQLDMQPTAVMATCSFVFLGLAALLALVFIWRAGRRLSYA